PWLYYSSDHLGSPRLITDQSRYTIASYTYRPFGLMASAETSGQGPAFAGMEKDFQSSNYYDHARYYGAPIFRFNVPDLVGGKAEDPQSWNRYTYAGNNPILRIDPDGLESPSVIHGCVGRCNLTPRQEVQATAILAFAGVALAAPAVAFRAAQTL